MTQERKQQTGPRLVKAADLAARRAKEEQQQALAKAKPEPNIDAMLKAATRGRGQDGARGVFDSLFAKPAA
jgi:hypothetical protein